MLDFLIRYCLGFYHILISGNKYNINRFLNILSHNNITYWNKEVKDDKCYFCICLKDYKKITKPIEKSGIEHEIVYKKGLPYFFFVHKKRKIFFICLIVSLVYFCRLNQYIWNIQVKCGAYYSDLHIDELLRKEVKIGLRKNKIDCNKIENIIINKYNQFSWVNCYIKATTFVCEFSETNNPSFMSLANKPCNIVACKDCIIESSIAENGNNLVQAGQTVKKGDILISGSINIKNDYDEIVDTKLVPSNGEVLGIVKREYKKVISMNYYSENNKSKKTRWNIGYGDQFLFKIKKDNDYEIISENHQLKIGKNIYLPFIIQKNTYIKNKLVKNTYTRKEASYKQKLILNEYIKELEKYGVEIIENNVKIYFEDNKCIAKGTITTKENVGIPQAITLDTQGE